MTLTLTLSLGSWATCSARLAEGNMCVNLMKIDLRVQEICSGHQIQG